MTPFFCWYILESVNRGSGGAIMASAIMANSREWGTPIEQFMASAAEWPAIQQSGDLIFGVAENQLIYGPFGKWNTWKYMKTTRLRTVKRVVLHECTKRHECAVLHEKLWIFCFTERRHDTFSLLNILDTKWIQRTYSRTPFFCWYILESVNRGSGEWVTPIEQFMASAAEWPSIQQSGDLIFDVAKNQPICENYTELRTFSIHPKEASSVFSVTLNSPL